MSIGRETREVLGGTYTGMAGNNEDKQKHSMSNCDGCYIHHEDLQVSLDRASHLLTEKFVSYSTRAAVGCHFLEKALRIVTAFAKPFEPC